MASKKILDHCVLAWQKNRRVSIEKTGDSCYLPVSAQLPNVNAARTFKLTNFCLLTDAAIFGKEAAKIFEKFLAGNNLHPKSSFVVPKTTVAVNVAARKMAKHFFAQCSRPLQGVRLSRNNAVQRQSFDHFRRNNLNCGSGKFADNMTVYRHVPAAGVVCNFVLASQSITKFLNVGAVFDTERKPHVFAANIPICGQKPQPIRLFFGVYPVKKMVIALQKSFSSASVWPAPFDAARTQNIQNRVFVDAEQGRKLVAGFPFKVKSLNLSALLVVQGFHALNYISFKECG